MNDDTEKNYVVTFTSQPGKSVLRHLRDITIERFLGPNATESELRALEGQRALVHQIESAICRGQSNQGK